MLQAIACIYSSVPLRARVDGAMSDNVDEVNFISIQGVKQGDPISPLLFGLFIDGVERHVKSLAPSAGVRTGDMRFGCVCPLLFNADDLVLLASTAEQLQRRLDAIADFCQQYDMQVNVQTLNQSSGYC